MSDTESKTGNDDSTPIELEEPSAAGRDPKDDAEADGKIEAEEASASEPVQPSDPQPRAEVQEIRRGPGWLGLVLGGVVAAGAGFGVAQYVPDGWPIQDTTELQDALNAQKQKIDALEVKLAALSGQPQVPDLTERVEALEAGQKYALSQITELNARPQGSGDPGLAAEIAALKEQMSGLQSVAPTDTAAAEAILKEAQDAAEKIKSEAEASARKAELRAALGRVQAALDSGAAYGSALATLGEVPAVLRDNAVSGVPSLSALQDAFPEAARAALDASLRSDMGESWTERTLNFLRTQTGARSLTPIEGDSPDAILSRAEDALRKNDLTQALAEVDSLPDVSKTAMSEWRAMAKVRQDAIQAAAELAATLEE